MVAKCELKLIKHATKKAFRFSKPGIKKYWVIGSSFAIIVTLLIGANNLPFVMLLAILILYIEAHRACR